MEALETMSCLIIALLRPGDMMDVCWEQPNLTKLFDLHKDALEESYFVLSNVNLHTDQEKRNSEEWKLEQHVNIIPTRGRRCCSGAARTTKEWLD